MARHAQSSLALSLSLAALVAAASASWSAPTAATLPPHPRIIVDATRLHAVQAFIGNNSQAANYYQQLQAQGEYVLSVPPMVRPPLNASDILAASRAVLQRIYITALLYRLTGNESYAARTVAELVNCTQWANWDIGPHALDTGELCHATAVGFDWTYDYLSRPEHAAAKATIITGMVSLGMTAFREAYNSTSPPWWTSNPSNWAVVTNGGASIAALALLGEQGVPEWVGTEVLPRAMDGVLSSVTRPYSAADGTGNGFDSDGAWWEGPIYHGYTCRYFIPFVTAVETALGPAYSNTFWSLPGALSPASYQSRIMSNDYNYFNWADSEDGQETLAELLAVAWRANDAAAAWRLRDHLDRTPPSIASIDTGAQSMEYANALVHFTDIGSTTDLSALPLDAAYPRKKLVLLRSGWTTAATTTGAAGSAGAFAAAVPAGPGSTSSYTSITASPALDVNASFLGIKACNCSWNHGDLDSGQWVYSWGGVRWVADLGSDNYGLPDYFGSPHARYRYYRKGSYGHNVLIFDGQQQDMDNCTSDSVTELAAFNSNSGVVYNAAADSPLPQCSLSSLHTHGLTAGSTGSEDGAAAMADAGPFEACAVVNLTAAYARPIGLAAVTRTFALLPGRTSVVVSDRWTTSAASSGHSSPPSGSADTTPTISLGLPGNVTWQLHTFQEVATPAGGTGTGAVTLTSAVTGASITLTIPPSSPCAASAVTWRAIPVRLPEPQYTTHNLTRVEAVVLNPAACGGIDVRLDPVQ